MQQDKCSARGCMGLWKWLQHSLVMHHSIPFVIDKRPNYPYLHWGSQKRALSEVVYVQDGGKNNALYGWLDVLAPCCLHLEGQLLGSCT